MWFPTARLETTLWDGLGSLLKMQTPESYLESRLNQTLGAVGVDGGRTRICTFRNFPGDLYGITRPW